MNHRPKVGMACAGIRRGHFVLGRGGLASADGYAGRTGFRWLLVNSPSFCSSPDSESARNDSSLENSSFLYSTQSAISHTTTLLNPLSTRMP